MPFWFVYAKTLIPYSSYPKSKLKMLPVVDKDDSDTSPLLSDDLLAINI